VQINNALQWAGAMFIIAGHLLNTLIEFGYKVEGLNIAAFAIGTVAFLTWTVRVANRPQMVVNVVAIIVCAIGLVRVYA